MLPLSYCLFELTKPLPKTFASTLCSHVLHRRKRTISAHIREQTLFARTASVTTSIDLGRPGTPGQRDLSHRLTAPHFSLGNFPLAAQGRACKTSEMRCGICQCPS